MPLILHCIYIKSFKVGLTVIHLIVYVQLMVNLINTYLPVKVIDSCFFKVLCLCLSIS